MRLPSLLPALVAAFVPTVAALNILRSTSLSTCMENSGFSATLFNVSFTPDDGQLRIQILGDSTIGGPVWARVTVIAYGFPVMSRDMDPCKTKGLGNMCPMRLSDLDMTFQETIDPKTISQIPVIAYKIPDLDGVARMEVLDNDHVVVACVEAPLSNGQTVEQAAIGWVTAAISGTALVASAVVAGNGHVNTAAHLAANALSLFAYFQAQAMVAMMAVPLPPLASAWAQNYDWSVGIIEIPFMQKIFHWYIQATSGTPANLFRQQEKVSVQIAKRSFSPPPYHTTRAARYGFARLAKRSNNVAAVSVTPKLVRITGIQRMSYKAGIESTNFFLTGLSFFVAFVLLVTILVSAFRLFCNTSMIRRHDRFREFRAKWLVVLKGIMYRVMLIGLSQMAVLCPWEWLRRDSPAALTVSVFFFAAMVGTLGWAAYQILTIARYSTSGPAYALYTDPASLNRWGYLYVSFRSERYYFIAPQLVYLLSKSLVISFAQSNGVAQSIIVLCIDLLYLGTVCKLTPWLDRRTNIVNIGIASINALNGALVMVFSGVTTAPKMVHGVFGVVFFFVNAVFALVLLVLLVISVSISVFGNDPERRYLGVVAGGEEKTAVVPVRDLDDGEAAERPESERAVSRAVFEPRRSGSVATTQRRGYAEQDSVFVAPSAAGGWSEQRGRGYQESSGQGWNVGAGYDR